MSQIFSKILIANRGEIACRVAQTAKRLNIKTVAVYSDADADARHVELADEAVYIGPSPVSQSYLDRDAIIKAAQKTGAQAIHPGYGFLSENPDFVEAVEEAGLVFIGPSTSSIKAMGLKDGAKQLMSDAGVPVVPGYHGADQEKDFLKAQAEQIGYPVLIKARAGGGGKGMRLVNEAAEFDDALQSAQREAQSSFGDDRVLIEKFITAPRHIEVQVFGDNHGNVVHMFERDCSLQRRHQKVIEEAPAPAMTDQVRQAMTDAAVTAAKAINYSGAGTIEFIVDGSGPLRKDGFWFMEMNTRLQVEHPVTECVTGLDLVEWQLRVAAGEKLPLAQKDITLNGHACEARLYAEDPGNSFLPQTGMIHHLDLYQDARNDAGVRQGDAVTPYYDPMISKIIVHEDTRDTATEALCNALRQTHVAGLVTNVAFLAKLAAHPDFKSGDVDTGLIDRDLAQLVDESETAEEALPIAAIVALECDMSQPNLGWRLWGQATHQLELDHQGQSLRIQLALMNDGSISVTADDINLKVRDFTLHDGAAHMRVGENNKRIKASVAQFDIEAGKAVSVCVQGSTTLFVRPDQLLGEASETDHEDDIVAPMTGTVVAVHVAKGAKVNKGDNLLVVEAMKMETNLYAPRDGLVAEILSADGASVEGGQTLLRLEPSS